LFCFHYKNGWEKYKEKKGKKKKKKKKKHSKPALLKAQKLKNEYSM